MNIIEYEAIIEAILFASGEAVNIKNIAYAINKDIDSTKVLINNLAEKYIIDKRGIIIIEVGETYQMCTNPDYFEYIKSLYSKPQKKSLSSAILETLAIIAYKQPITKSGIEKIRGVNVDHAINKLIKYNLVSERGRLDAPGKPILFGTTNEFLKSFGFKNLSLVSEVYEDNKNIIKQN